MNLTEAIEDLQELRRSLGDVEVTLPYDLCGTSHHKSLSYVLVGVDSDGNKVVELL